MTNRKMQRRSVRASTLNASIGKSSSPLIIPSATTGTKISQIAADIVECGCGSCGFKFKSVAHIGKAEFAPMCANCGSGQVTSKKVQVSSVVETDAVMAAVQCPKCNVYQLQASAVAESMAAGYHCVTCGEEQILTPEVAPEGAEEPVVAKEEDETCEVVVDDITNADPTPVPAVLPADIDPSGPVVDAIIAPDSTTPVVAADVVDESQKEVSEEVPVDDLEIQDDSFGVEDTDDMGLEESQDDTMEDLDDLDMGEDFPEATEADEEVQEDLVTDDDTIQFSETVELDAEENGDQIEFDMLPEEDQDDTELSFVYVGTKLHAFANDLHVATLKKETAGKNADLFNSDVLVRAVVASCREHGIRKGLQSAGFKVVRVSVPVQAFVAKKVKTALAAVKASETSAVKVTADDWKQSIAVALAGLNKNFFAGKDHPLRSSLVTELSALGVRNPSKLLDRVFAAHGAKFNSAVMELATEIQSKPLEVRNQLAQTLDSANYMSTAETEEDFDEEDDEIEQMPVTSRLNGSGHRIVKKSAQTASKEVATSGSRVSAIIASAGGSLFSNSHP